MRHIAACDLFYNWNCVHLVPFYHFLSVRLGASNLISVSLTFLPRVPVWTEWQNAVTRCWLELLQLLWLRAQAPKLPHSKREAKPTRRSRTSEMTEEPLPLSPTAIWQKRRDMQTWEGNPQKSHWPRKRAWLSFSPPPMRKGEQGGAPCESPAAERVWGLDVSLLSGHLLRNSGPSLCATLSRERSFRREL